MTSKISCIKFIKEDLRQRTWLIAILSTVTFLFQPLMLIIGINEKKNWINTVSPGFTMKDFKFWLFNFMGFNNNAVVFCVILFAVCSSDLVLGCPFHTHSRNGGRNNYLLILFR